MKNIKPEIRKHHIFLSPVLILILILCAFVTGCFSRSTAYRTYSESGSAVSSNGGFTAMAKSTYADMADMDDVMYEADESPMAVYDTAYEEDIEESFASGYDSGSSSSTVASETQPAATSESTNQVSKEKLVYTGSLNVETTDFEATLARIRQDITDMGGFIESEDDSDDSYGWYMDGYTKSSSTLSSYIQARIPSARFYEFLDGIEGDTAKVTSRSVNVQNISRRYSETAGAIESYEIQEERLLDMMKDAKRVSDMLEIEQRLSEVQASLKSYRNSLSDMDTDVAYSTVSIRLREVGIYSKPEQTTFGQRVHEAFTYGLESFRDGAESLFLWLVENFLGILVLIVVIWIIYKIIKRIVKKIIAGWRRNKAAKNESEGQVP